MKSHTAERAPWFQGQRLGRSFENQAEDSAVITWDSPRGHPVLALKVGFKGRSVVLEEGLEQQDHWAVSKESSGRPVLGVGHGSAVSGRSEKHLSV